MTSQDSNCAHRWRQVYESSHVGSPFPIGYRCVDCLTFVSQHEIPAVRGLGGTDTGQKELIGIHGGKFQCSDGSLCTKQIRYPDGTLQVIR